MSKNILVLTGSPRRGGNSDRMADAFIRGAEASGHRAVKFETAFHPVQGCRDCRACWSTGSACVTADGFRELEPLLEQADALVFATPLYWFGMTAQLKAAIDKMNAYTIRESPRTLKIRESALLICGADGIEGPFAGAVQTYNSMADYMKWADRGRIVVTGVLKVGDIEKTDALFRAEELGKSF